MQMIEQFYAASRAGAPLVAVSTPDAFAFTRTLLSDARFANKALITWDCGNGAVARNEAGEQVCEDILAELGAEDLREASIVASEFFNMFLGANQREAIFLVHNAHRMFEARGVENLTIIQGILNRRDPFKMAGAMIAFLGPVFVLPIELQQDTLLLDEPLPSEAELQAIVTQIYADAQVKPEPKKMSASVDALRGLAAFPAEQAAAMSIKKAGMDIDQLWERKRKMIETTPGLGCWRDGDKFADVGGCQNVKTFLSKVITGREAPRVIVFVDEIEKMLGGASQGDTSGVSQGFLGTLLTYMQDTASSGCIFIGPPGAAKSQIAKAVGNEASIPTVQLDLNGMKGSLVGESEGRLRTALKTISAVGDGRALFIATCNSINSLPPELRRRFTLGTFFFDLPTEEERKAIWDIYLAKYPEADQDVAAVDDKDWTGAEIKQAVVLSYRLGITLAQAASYIVPVARAAGDSIKALRNQASGKFISAGKPGIYHAPVMTSSTMQPLPERQGRKITNS